jgi:hypothetical protein
VWPEECCDYYFEHERNPHVKERYWRYPFPIANIDESSKPEMQEQTAYLFCDTKKAYVQAYSTSHKYLHKAQLRNASGSNIGQLTLHNQDQYEQFPSIEVAEAGAAGKRIEVVAICRQQKWSREIDDEKRDYSSKVIFEEWYTVLWIEWENGVAYRMASGEIERAEWEKMELEDVSLVLG